MSTKLKCFEGHDVVTSRIAVTNAGDGLSEAMQVDPVDLQHGGKVYLVMEAEVAKVRFDPSKDDPDALIRVHVLRATTATMVDEDLVAEVLAEQRDKIVRWREEQEGVQRLDLDVDVDVDLDLEQAIDDDIDPPADPDDAAWEASAVDGAMPEPDPEPADEVSKARRRRGKAASE